MSVLLLRVGKYFTLLQYTRNVKLVEIASSARFIMTSRIKLDKVLEDLKRNPFYDKYAKKIAQVQETNPEEFLLKAEQEKERVNNERERQVQERKFQQTSKAKPTLEPSLHKKEARLSDVMKLELIEGKTKEEIIDIWQQYHHQKDCISGTMSSEQFDKMFKRGREHATFLLPLPRYNGYEFIVCQFDRTEIHMTPLLWFQTHQENAPECLTMLHYTELKDSKDVVLMRGEFDSKSINVQEAQCLANELQLYYSSDDPRRLQLVETFTKKPDEFKHMDLIAQLENISLKATPDSSVKTNKCS